MKTMTKQKEIFLKCLRKYVVLLVIVAILFILVKVIILSCHKNKEIESSVNSWGHNYLKLMKIFPEITDLPSLTLKVGVGVVSLKF